jgi:hypothetical protein
MAWKQDLAKLKQQLGPESPAPAPKAVPKPALKPRGPSDLEDEDAVFLSAMGLKPATPRPVQPTVDEVAVPTPVVPEPPVPETFQAAVKELKGLKPMRQGLPGHADAPPKPPTQFMKQVEPLDPLPAKLAVAPPAAVPAPEPEPPTVPFMPSRFQLAAGMAIEVDGALDLRGHSLMDAMERLKDRLGDGQVLGWRSLLVNLGPDLALHEGLLTFLASGQAVMVARYAQAPVPMGGTQAWLLYLAPPPAQP